MNAEETKLAKNLEAFIDGHNFQYFKGKEFTWYWDRVRNGQKNTVPPAALWPNIIPTLAILNFLRSRIGHPIIMTSTYRSPAYNKAIDGATQSFHTKFQAIDFQCAEVTPRKLHSLLTELRSHGMFKGGLGLYQTFVHVDTRGYNADWKGSGV